MTTDIAHMDVFVVVIKMAKVAQSFESKSSFHAALYFYSQMVELLSNSRDSLSEEHQRQLETYEAKAAFNEEKSLMTGGSRESWLKAKQQQDIQVARALFRLVLELDEETGGKNSFVAKLYEQSAEFCYEVQDGLPSDRISQMDRLSVQALDRAEELKRSRKTADPRMLDRYDDYRASLPARYKDQSGTPQYGTLKVPGEKHLPPRPNLPLYWPPAKPTEPAKAVMLGGSKMIADPDFNLESTVPPLNEFLNESELSSMDKENINRLKAAYELFHTEKVHVRHLKVINEVFYLPLLMSQIISGEDLTLLFDQLDKILDVHIKLRDLLVETQRSDPKFTNLSRTLLAAFEGEIGEELSVASSKFCQRQQAAIDALTTRLSKDVKFESFLIQAESSPYCRQQKLRDTLPVEMQRLSKYPLLFEQILKHTQEGTEEFEQLQKLVECGKSLLKGANETKRQWENVFRLQVLQSRVDTSEFDSEVATFPQLECYKNLSLDCFNLIHEGELELKTGKTRLVPLHSVLLNGLLVMLTKTNSPTRDFSLKIYNKISGDELGDTISRSLRRLSKRMDIGTEYLSTSRLYFPVLDLTKVIVTKSFEVPTSFYLIYSDSDGSRQIYDLKTTSKAYQSEWCRELNEQIRVARRKKRLPETLLPNRRYHSFNGALKPPDESLSQRPFSEVVRAQTERPKLLQRKPVVMKRTSTGRKSFVKVESTVDETAEKLTDQLNQIDLLASAIIDKLNNLGVDNDLIKGIRTDAEAIKTACKTP